MLTKLAGGSAGGDGKSLHIRSALHLRSSSVVAGCDFDQHLRTVEISFAAKDPVTAIPSSLSTILP